MTPTDQQCRWFLYCTNPATHETPHPVLGSVPTCERCYHLANGNR